MPIPAEQAWEAFTDVEGIAPCMAGAEVVEVVDDRTYRDKSNVKLGPVRLTFKGDGRFEEMDPARREVKIRS